MRGRVNWKLLKVRGTKPKCLKAWQDGLDGRYNNNIFVKIEKYLKIILRIILLHNIICTYCIIFNRFIIKKYNNNIINPKFQINVRLKYKVTKSPFVETMVICNIYMIYNWDMVDMGVKYFYWKYLYRVLAPFKLRDLYYAYIYDI